MPFFKLTLLALLALLALFGLPAQAGAAGREPDIVIEGRVARSEIERILRADNVDTSQLSEREVADSIARVERGRAPRDFWIAYRAHVLAWKRLADAVEKGSAAAAVAEAEQAVEATFDEVEHIARAYGARMPTPPWERLSTV